MARSTEPRAERVRRAIEKLEAKGKKLTVAAVRYEARTDMQFAGDMLRLYKAGELDLQQRPWKDPTKAEEPLAPAGSDARARLADMIASIATDEDRQAVLREVQRLHALGEINASDVKAQQALLGEARQTARDMRSVPKTEADQIVLASEEGLRLLSHFERIVDPETRASLVATVGAAADLDATSHPTVDPVGEL